MAEPVRVLQVTAGFSLETLGGVERFTFDLSRALRSHGVDVTIAGLWQFDTPYEVNWMKSLESDGISVVMGCRASQTHPLQALLRSIRSMRQQLLGHTFEIIHSQQEFGDLVALALKRTVHAKKLVRSVHNDVEWRKRPLRRVLLSNFLLPLAFDTESGISKNIVAQLNHRPIAKLLKREHPLVYNTVDLSRFVQHNVDKPLARAKLGYSDDSIIIGSVGRLNEQKGYSYLIEAARYILNEIPNARFFIAGSGEMQSQLQNQIEANGLQNVFRLLGPRTEIPDVYAAMDVFVSSSLWEGLPTVMLEAMMLNVPVVATDVPGNNELVIHAQTGMLFPAADPLALAYAVCKAIRDPDHSARLAESAHNRARLFTIDNSAKAFYKLYKQLLH